MGKLSRIILPFFCFLLPLAAQQGQERTAQADERPQTSQISGSAWDGHPGANPWKAQSIFGFSPYTPHTPGAITTSISSSGPIDTGWVRHFASGEAPTTDLAGGMAMDKDGNVYVAGTTEWTTTLLKYSAGGDLLWMKKYSPFSFLPSVACDDGGFIYLAGDNWTMKCDGNGDTVWVRQSSLGGSPGIAVTGEGDVYVCGSHSFAGSAEYALIKYDSQGNVLWSRFSGVEMGYLQSFAVDSRGTVHVTGYAGTLAYASDGAMLWSDPEPGFHISLQADSSIIVCGDSTLTQYSLAGVVGWRVRNGSGGVVSALTTDREGNVYTTLNVGFNESTVNKWSPQGVPIWSTRCPWTCDVADLITVDGNGNVYLVGNDNDDVAVAKISVSGDSLWSHTYDGARHDYDFPSALLTDSIGSVFVLSTTDATAPNTDNGGLYWGDIVTTKINGLGDTVWNRKCGGQINAAALVSLQLDGQGNIFVVCSDNEASDQWSTRRWLEQASSVLLRYDALGNVQWMHRYASPSGLAFPTALGLDADGNPIVTGLSGRQFDSLVYMTTKYTAAGETSWMTSFAPSFSFSYSTSSRTGLEIDRSENIVIVGPGGDGSDGDILLRYTPTGDRLWAQPTGSFTDGNIRVSSNGHIYLTGTAGTMCYGTDGAKKWSRGFSGGVLAIDAAENVYVGAVTGSYPDVLGVLVKYDGTGDSLWSNKVSNITRISDIATDSKGNTIVIGQSDIGLRVVQCDPSGSILWETVWPELNWGILELAADDNIYISGNTQDASRDLFTARCNSDGSKAWSIRHSFGEGSSFMPAVIRVDPSGNVYVGGTKSERPPYFGSRVVSIVQYIQTATAVGSGTSSGPDAFSLDQNYPNPFNPSTDIRFQIPDGRRVRLSVFDVLGREVAVLVNQELQVGVHTTTWDAAGMASGLYFYRMEAVSVDDLSKRFVDVKKIVLLK